jgi:hypothetical protein
MSKLINAILQAFGALLGIHPDWDSDEYQAKHCQEYED